MSMPFNFKNEVCGPHWLPTTSRNMKKCRACLQLPLLFLAIFARNAGSNKEVAVYTSIIISAPPTALWASSSPAAASSTNGPVIDGRPRPGPAVGALPGCHPAGGGLPGGGGAARGAQRHGRARRAARPRRRAAEHAAEFKAFVHRGLEATLGARGRAPPAPRATRSRARRLVEATCVVS